MKANFYGIILVFLCVSMPLMFNVNDCAALTPVAEFSATPTAWNAPATVAFTDNSTGNVTGWMWSFGDGGQSDLKNPVHIYEQPGKYSVSLTVTSADGTNTKVKADYVTVEEHVPVGNEHLIRVDSAAHAKFGLYYPVTYKFRLPPGAGNLAAQYRYWEGAWSLLPEMHRGDNFNGVDAVRFDYTAGFAYISARFSRSSDSLYLRVVDAAGQPLALTFDSIPRFYDERKTAVTITLDDWDAGSDSYIRAATDLLASANLYFSVGLIVKSVPWSSVQQKINEHGDFMEIASHSVDHVCSATDYAKYGYDTQATGSRDAIRKNLSFKAQPYVPLYIEPCGYSDSTLQAALTAADYLLTRCSNDYIPSGANFISWDASQLRYGRGALTFTDIRYNDGDVALLNDANRIFNDALAAGTIYHLVDHSWKGFWYPNSYLMQHLDYVKGRSDVWYVPFGHLYQYHFLQEKRGNLTIQPLTAAAAVASFSATPLAGTAPLAVSFTDTSSGSISGWLWDFGDSTTSTSQSPVHVYDTVGTFTVKLTVTGPGGSSSKTETNLVAVTPANPAAVTITAPANAASYTAPATVTITATASAGSGAEVKQVDFFANAAQVGTATAAPYTATWKDVVAGAYSLTAKITDTLGGTAVSNPVAITVNDRVAPAVKITSPADGASYTAPASLSITATATASTGATINRVDFYANQSLMGTATTAPYAVNWTDIASGTYVLTSKVTDSAGETATSAPVTITVNAAVAPTVTITAPVNGATYTAPASVSVAATATAGTGAAVQRVDFYGNGTLAGTATAAPYTATLNDLAAGNYSLTAKVTDTLGGTATSPPVAITVNAYVAPVVSIASPANGASYTAPAAVSITATPAAGTGATVAQVDIFANGALVGTATSTPYTVTWNNVAAGNYSLTARVTDSRGATSTSPPVSISVIPKVASTVTITAPASGASYTAPANIRISASATAGTGTTVKQVDFYANDALVGTAATSPFSVNWTKVNAGNYTLTAKVTDATGEVATSQPVTVTVLAYLAPAVTITAPDSGASFTAPATIPITATATAGSGATVKNVAFYANNSLIGTASTSPYSVTWNNATAGTYSVTAKVTDSSNATATSAPAAITVKYGLPDLTIAKTHKGTMKAGRTGTYVITVKNSGFGPTTAGVTVTDALPVGLTATAISGTGWTCSAANAAPLSCTRGDALPAGSSYPPINVSVTISSSAPSSVTNTATVSGGGEQNAANNTASDAVSVR